MELSYYSTLFLTLLLLVGLVFFLRGSTKDRTTIMELPDQNLTPKIRDYLLSLGYRVQNLDPDRDVVTLTGQVRASVGLAILLSLLATIGLGCLSLVLSLLFPEWGNGVYLLVGGAPIAGAFYWRGAQKTEEIKITARDGQLVIQGHRDALRNIENRLSEPG
jgi:uncharacterized membrane protein YphA (DoxX/SURF4 family)